MSIEIEERTAEYVAEDLAPSVPYRVRCKVTFAAKSDLGRVRENNEDKFEFFVPESDGVLASRGSIFLVCDGMGGHAAGQIASELATKNFIDVYLNHPATEPEIAMLGAVGAANRFVLDNSRAFPDRKGMGTTLSGLVLIQDAVYTVQVGDSRIYLFRDGEVRQLTEDHTWVDEALKAGIITAEEGVNHPYKHVLTRAIGAEPDIRPDIVRRDVQVGDIYLLCSDGVTNHVDEVQIHTALSSLGTAEAAWRLIGQALQGGGSDNATILIVRVDELVDITA